MREGREEKKLQKAYKEIETYTRHLYIHRQKDRPAKKGRKEKRNV